MSQHNQTSGNIDIDTGPEMVGGRKTMCRCMTKCLGNLGELERKLLQRKVKRCEVVRSKGNPQKAGDMICRERHRARPDSLREIPGSH